jgi:hypothetical protein
MVSADPARSQPRAVFQLAQEFDGFVHLLIDASIQLAWIYVYRDVG